MKTIKFILPLLLVVLLYGCKKHNCIPNSYNLQLRFEDGAGNDKIKGIKYDTKTGMVNSEEYVFKSSLSTNAQSFALLNIIETQGRYCLYTADDTSHDYIAPSITHTLKCLHVFGDIQEHTIVSYWYEAGRFTTACSKVTFDGKDISVTKDEYGNASVLITLDN